MVEFHKAPPLGSRRGIAKPARLRMFNTLMRGEPCQARFARPHVRVSLTPGPPHGEGGLVKRSEHFLRKAVQAVRGVLSGLGIDQAEELPGREIAAGGA